MIYFLIFFGDIFPFFIGDIFPFFIGDIFPALPVSWSVTWWSLAVPSAAAYNWTFLVFCPTAKMVRFIKSNCAGEAHDLPASAQVPECPPPKDETGFDLMFNSISILVGALQC